MQMSREESFCARLLSISNYLFFNVNVSRWNKFQNSNVQEMHFEATVKIFVHIRIINCHRCLTSIMFYVHSANELLSTFRWTARKAENKLNRYTSRRSTCSNNLAPGGTYLGNSTLRYLRLQWSTTVSMR